MTAKIECYRPSAPEGIRPGKLRLPTDSEVKELVNLAYDFAKGKWTRFAQRFQVPRHLWVSAECVGLLCSTELKQGRSCDVLPLRLVSDSPFEGSIRIGKLYWQNASQQTVCDSKTAASYDRVYEEMSLSCKGVFSWAFERTFTSGL